MVTVQALKLLNAEAHNGLSGMYNRYATTTEQVKGWSEVTTWLIPKKSGVDTTDNLRPVVRLSHLYKVFLRAITFRMR